MIKISVLSVYAVKPRLLWSIYEYSCEVNVSEVN